MINTNIDKLAAIFHLPRWESVNGRNEEHYADALKQFEDQPDDEALRAVIATSAEVYRRWHSAVFEVADTLLSLHGLLLAPEVTLFEEISPSYNFTVFAARSWEHAADAIRHTINRLGVSYFPTLSDFLTSGPYTAKEAVQEHLTYVADYWDVSAWGLSPWSSPYGLSPRGAS